MTVNEIKQLLDERGVEYPSKATKAELEALLESTNLQSNDEGTLSIYQVTAETKIRVRSTTDTTTDSNAIGVLEPGTYVVVSREMPDWVGLANGGYVMANLVTKIEQ